MATLKFVLRYNSLKQKEKLEKIAKKCGRSANSHILQLIDKDISGQPVKAKSPHQ